MSEQNWGCLDKMSEVNFSPAETLVIMGQSQFNAQDVVLALIWTNSMLLSQGP